MTAESVNSDNGVSSNKQASTSQLGIFSTATDRAIQGLFFLALLYTLYFAQSLIIPLLATALISLLLNPIVSLLHRLYIPRALSAVVLLALLVTPMTILSIELAEPAQKWAKLIPKFTADVSKKIDSISEQFQLEKQNVDTPTEKPTTKEDQGFDFFGWFKKEEPKPVSPQPAPEKKNVVTEKLKLGGVDIILNLIGAAPLFIGQVLSSLVLTVFLLIFGPNLLQATIQGFSSRDKRVHAIKLYQALETELSRYVLTVSIINFGLGALTALALYFIGMEDALLWGAMVGLFNFMPYLGSVISTSILCIAGIVQYGFQWDAALPAVVFLSLNMVEAQFVTPTMLGKSMKINPLVVIVWLIVCAWLWGVAGVLLSVPLLVCIKLTLVQLGIWQSFIKATTH